MNKQTSSWLAWVVLGLALVLVVLILLASWTPDSRMAELGWVPKWLGELADRDPNVRTAVPFVPLVVLLARGLGYFKRKRSLLLAVVASLVLLGLAEFGQAFLLHRSADVLDLVWGGVGIGFGAALVACARACRRQ